eukprot:9922438-Alexandrium_andersonii.AAC.1
MNEGLGSRALIAKDCGRGGGAFPGGAPGCEAPPGRPQPQECLGGASGTSFEAALGPTHFKLGPPEAMLHVPRGRE